MTFVAQFSEEQLPLERMQEQEVCFECGGKLSNSAVYYNGFANHHQQKSILLHPGCAAVMGQRLITDGYPNRRKS